MAKDPKWRPDDDLPMGANADGKVEVLSPEQYQQRLMERDAEEALDNLDDLEEDFGAEDNDGDKTAA